MNFKNIPLVFKIMSIFVNLEILFFFFCDEKRMTFILVLINIVVVIASAIYDLYSKEKNKSKERKNV